ncbi:MAG: hypothetical protein E6G94_01690 [Alphaproteobacteria bacterium]|nr:MAG: hypothetical protein E6G94_01690 [Alphaproteobacteria bacterium]
MVVNRKSIATTAPGADAFTFSDGNGALVNFGNLSAAGGLADGIRVTAAGASVVNHGSIVTSGDGSDGIGAGGWFGALDGVSVTNFGTIASSGNATGTDDAPEYPTGIELFGENERITNHGTITSRGIDGSGVSLVGSHGEVRNYGTIDAEAIGIVLDSLTGEDHANSIENFGLIRTHDLGLAHGIWVFTDGNDIVNRGTIRAEGVHDFGIALEGMNNHSANYGVIAAAGEEARGVLITNEGNDFTNYGRIEASGADGIGVRFSFDDGLSLTGSLFTNRGTVDASGGGYAILGSIPDEQVVNRGTLNGDVDMGDGNDRFVAGSGGHLNGLLTLGDGNDRITIERHGGDLVIGDFAASGASQDVLDLSAFHLRSFADVMSHASQTGGDVILTLAGDTHVTLQGVGLTALNPADFITG